MILTVYSRFFKLYMASAIAPILWPVSRGQPSGSIGVAFIKSYAAICLEGCMIVLACIIFSQFAAAPPAIADDTMAAATIVWKLYRGIGFQYAGSGGRHQDERPAGAGVDGTWLIPQVVNMDDTAAVAAGLPHPLDQNFLFFLSRAGAAP